METVHTEEYRGKTIKIIHDTEPENPREWENQTTMACFHSRYNLGDKLNEHDLEHVVLDLWLEHASDSELRNKIKRDHGNFTMSQARELIESGYTWKDRFELFYRYDKNILGKQSSDLELPRSITWNFLYLYDHSGITISMSPFSCIFDSGIVGIIYMIDNPKNPMTYEEQLKIMKSEVRTYDDYLTGNCYGFQIEDSNGDTIDSCYGFLGDYKHCLTEARSQIE